MDDEQRDNRLFGILALGLVITGLLGPFIIYGISGQDCAGGFLFVSLALGLVFGIIGRRSKPGLIAMTMTAVALVLTLVMVLMYTS